MRQVFEYLLHSKQTELLGFKCCRDINAQKINLNTYHYLDVSPDILDSQIAKTAAAPNQDPHRMFVTKCLER